MAVSPVCSCAAAAPDPALAANAPSKGGLAPARPPFSFATVPRKWLVRFREHDPTVAIADSAIDAWKVATFTAAELNDPTISGDLADPDAAGIANILEFALGLAARTPGALPLSPQILDARLELSLTRAAEAAHVAIIFEVSGNLAAWSDEPADVTATSITNGDGSVTFTGRDLTPVSAASRHFTLVASGFPGARESPKVATLGMRAYCRLLSLLIILHFPEMRPTRGEGAKTSCAESKGLRKIAQVTGGLIPIAIHPQPQNTNHEYEIKNPRSLHSLAAHLRPRCPRAASGCHRYRLP